MATDSSAIGRMETSINDLVESISNLMSTIKKDREKQETKEKAKKAVKSPSESLKKNIEESEKSLKIEQQKYELLKEQIAKYEEIVLRTKDQEERLEHELMLKEAVANQIEYSNDLLNKRIELEEKILKLMIDEEEADVDKLSDQQKLIDKLKIQIKKVEEIQKLETEVAAERGRALNDLGSKTQELLNRMSFGLINHRETWITSLKKAKDVTGSWAEAFKAAGKAAGEIITPLKVANSIGMKFHESIKNSINPLSENVAELNKLTGTTGEYTEKIIDVKQEYSTYMVGFAESAEAIKSLMTEMTGFRRLDAQIQNQLMGHTAVMTKLGISASDTSRFLDLSMVMLGKTADEAMGTQGTLIKFADTLKMSAEDLMKAYNESSDLLAIYGKKGTQVFANLAKAADRTGMSIKSLVSMAEKFNTFEEGADQVGRLNAMLGGSFLSNLEMTSLSYDERIKKIHQAIKASGLEWDALNQQQKLYIQTALGLESLEAAARFLKLEESDLTAELEKQNLTRKEAEERAKAFTSVQEKFKKIMEQFAIAMEPLLDVLNVIANFFMEIISLANKLPDALREPALIGIMLVIGSGIVLLKKLISGMFDSIVDGVFKSKKSLQDLGNKIQSSIPSAKGPTPSSPAGAIPQDPKKIESLGKASGSAAKNMLAFGAALLMVAAGIALVISSIALLANTIKGMTKEELSGLYVILGIVTGMFIIFSIGVLIAGKAAEKAAPGMMKFGLAVLAIGAGIALVIAATSLLVRAFAELIKAIDESDMGLGEILLMLTGMAAVAPLATAGLVAMAIGFSALGLAMGLLGLGLLLVSNKDLVQLANMFNYLGNITTANADAVQRMIGNIYNLSTALKNMPVFAFVSIGYMFEEFKGIGDLATNIAPSIEKIKSFVETTQTITPESNKNIKEYKDQLVTLLAEISAAKENGTDEFLDKLTKLFEKVFGKGVLGKTNQAAVGATVQTTPVTIELDGLTFAKGFLRELKKGLDILGGN